LFHHKEFCSDAESAIDELEKNTFDGEKLPDVIFLDLSMPRFSDFDFLAKFNKLLPQMTKNIDIFVMTASIDPRDKLKSEQYSFVKEVLIKPLNKAMLSEIYIQYKPDFALN